MLVHRLAGADAALVAVQKRCQERVPSRAFAARTGSGTGPLVASP